MAYKIEKNKPIPKVGPVNKGKSKYPFGSMKVGDSFILDEHYEIAVNKSIHKRALVWSRINTGGKWKFTCRRDGNKLRVWRIK